jgi:carboxymethylenebutenolidase
MVSEDNNFKPALRNDAEAIFAARKDKPDFIAYEFKDWKGTSRELSPLSCAHGYDITCTGTAHGFAIRPNQSVPEVKAGYDGALEQTVTWFKKTLSL